MNFREPTLGTSSPSEIGKINKDNRYSAMNFFPQTDGNETSKTYAFWTSEKYA